MLNALLIGNPSSGGGRSLPVGELPGRWMFDPARVTPDDLAGVDLVAFFGGDGTVQRTLSQLCAQIPFEALPAIAVLPWGTTNMTASNLNRSRRRASALRSLAMMIRQSRLETRPRRMLRVGGPHNQALGFFFGLGAIAALVERWRSERRASTLQNRMHTLKSVIGGLSRVNTHTAIELDGDALEVYGLLATTLDRLLRGRRPFWGPHEDDEIHLTWISAEARRLLARAPAVLTGSPRLKGIPGYDSRSVAELTLQFDGAYVVDGELFHTRGQSLTIRRTPALRWAVL